MRTTADRDMLRAVPDLLPAAVFVETAPGNRDDIRAAHQFYGAARVGGELRRVRLTVLEDRDGHRFYDQHSVRMERAADAPEGLPTLQSRTDPEAASPGDRGATINLGALLDGVNPERKRRAPTLFSGLTRGCFEAIRTDLSAKVGSVYPAGRRP